MPDFKTKKEVLRRLQAKRRKNKLMWLPCVIGESFVKIWYAIVCRAGLAFTDKNGKFLGVAEGRERSPRARRQDDIVYVKKPFWGRMLSAVLAAAFVMMFVPEILPELDLGITASADVAYFDIVIDGVPRRLYPSIKDPTKLFEEADYKAATAVTASITSCEKSNGYMRASWEIANNTGGYEVAGYEIRVTNTKDSKVYEKTENIPSPSVVDYVIEMENTKDYTLKVYPTMNVRAWTCIPAYDPAQPGLSYIFTEPQSINDVAALTSLQPGTNHIGVLDAKLDTTAVKDLPDITEGVDDLPTATIEWAAVDGAYGYKIFRKEGDGKWEMLKATVLNGTAAAGEPKTYTDEDITPGTHYFYFVEAYGFVWGGPEYNLKDSGMITSSGGSTGLSADDKATGIYTLKSGLQKDFYVAPARPTVTPIADPAKHLINVSWTFNGNADGIILVRADRIIPDSEWQGKIGINNLTDYLISRDVRDGKIEGLKFLGDPASKVKSIEDKDIVAEMDYQYYAIAYLNRGKTRIYGAPESKSASLELKLDPPQNLKTVATDGKVELSWDKVDHADGYILTITKLTDDNGTPIPEDTLVVGNLKTTKYTHDSFKGSDLLNGEKYRYEVKAYANVKTALSDVLMSDNCYPRTATVGVPLNSVQNLKAETTDGSIDLSWDAVKGAEGYLLHYRYQKKNGQTSEYTDKSVFDVSGTKYTHSGLNNGDKYFYYVEAYKTVSGKRVFSDSSDEVWKIVGIPLDAPKDFMGTTSDGRVSLTWTAVKGADGYILYFRKNGGSWEQIDVSKPGFEHIGLNNGDKYEYYVIAYKNVNGERVYSGTAEDSRHINFTVGDSLSAPKDFDAVTSDGKVDLTWSKVDGATGYVLYAYSNGSSFQFDLSTTKYTHHSLSNGDVWTYYVVAYKDVNGSRVYSAPTRSKTVTVGVSLNAVIDLVATAGNRQVDLTWSKVTGAEGYVVYLYNEDTLEFEPITVVSGTKYSHVGLKNGKTYTYMVAAFKTLNGTRFYGEYSMAVDAIPTTGSITDMDHSLNIKGTTPYGISHSEYISATANHGAFDESVDVYFTTNRESTKAVKDVLKHYAEGLKSFIIYPFDISIYHENTLIEVDPHKGYSVTVTMPIPDRLIAYRDYITVVHINEHMPDGNDETKKPEVISMDEELAEWANLPGRQLEVLPCAIVDIDNVWCVQFVCSSFSPYALVIYKAHLTDVSAGGGVFDGAFAGTFNSGVLLFTALPDIMPNNKKLKVVTESGKRYRIKKIEKR